MTIGGSAFPVIRMVWHATRCSLYVLGKHCKLADAAEEIVRILKPVFI